jgi:hypothetical protein
MVNPGDLRNPLTATWMSCHMVFILAGGLIVARGPSGGAAGSSLPY